MTVFTYFVALCFDRNEVGEFRAGDAKECPTAAAAIRAAEGMSRRGRGAIAFSRTGDHTTGEFQPAEILQQFGDVPPDDLLRGYEDPEIPLKEIVRVLGIAPALAEHRMDIGDLHSRNIGDDRYVRLSNVLVLKTKIDAQQRAMREMVKMAEDNGEA
jgi:hypothetical protein